MNTTNNPESERLTGSESQSRRQLIERLAASVGSGEEALAALMAAALGAGKEQLRESKAWRDRIGSALATIDHSILANTESLRAVTQSLVRVEAVLANQAEIAEGQKAGLARLETQLAHLTQVNGANAHNLEQVRLQAEGLARNFEKLSQEVLLREVKDPFFVAFARLYEAVYTLSSRQNGSDDLQSILNRIRNFMEDYNVELIHPDDGERVDPRRHQPVKQLPSPDASRHGHIASTFNVGLAQGPRVIQPARVEVFTFADSASAS